MCQLEEEVDQGAGSSERKMDLRAFSLSLKTGFSYFSSPCFCNACA